MNATNVQLKIKRKRSVRNTGLSAVHGANSGKWLSTTMESTLGPSSYNFQNGYMERNHNGSSNSQASTSFGTNNETVMKIYNNPLVKGPAK